MRWKEGERVRTCVMVGMEVGQDVEFAGLSSLVPVLAELVHDESGAWERPNEVRHGRRGAASPRPLLCFHRTENLHESKKIRLEVWQRLSRRLQAVQQ